MKVRHAILEVTNACFSSKDLSHADGMSHRLEYGALFWQVKVFLCRQSEGPPAVVTSLGYPELTVTVETMRGHVIGHPPRDLHAHTHAHTHNRHHSALVNGAPARACDNSDSSDSSDIVTEGDQGPI